MGSLSDPMCAFAATYFFLPDLIAMYCPDFALREIEGSSDRKDSLLEITTEKSAPLSLPFCTAFAKPLLRRGGSPSALLKSFSCSWCCQCTVSLIMQAS